MTGCTQAPQQSPLMSHLLIAIPIHASSISMSLRETVGLWDTWDTKPEQNEEAPTHLILTQEFSLASHTLPLPKLLTRIKLKASRSPQKGRIRAGVRFSLSVDCFLIILRLVYSGQIHHSPQTVGGEGNCRLRSI